MLVRLLLAAIAAGLIAGAVSTLVQAVVVTPLIVEAEVYEGGGGHADVSGAADHGHGAPASGPSRTVLTLLANLLVGVGYGLLLAAAIALRGRPVGWRSGVLWGLAGFAAFSLAPSLGLPPELPGTVAAELGARQLWWVATAAATAGGLAMLVFISRWPWRVAGGALIALPHLIGAPHPEVPGGTAPAALAAQFAMMSLAAAAVFWAVLGAASGHLFARFGPPADAA